MSLERSFSGDASAIMIIIGIFFVITLFVFMAIRTLVSFDQSNNALIKNGEVIKLEKELYRCTPVKLGGES